MIRLDKFKIAFVNLFSIKYLQILMSEQTLSFPQLKVVGRAL